MKARGNQFLKDKSMLVLLVLGLMTILAAAGTAKIMKEVPEEEEIPKFAEEKEEEFLAEMTPVTPELPEIAETEAVLPPETEAAPLPDQAPLLALEEEPCEVADTSLAEPQLLDFTEDKKLLWPLNGPVILGYSMDTTTYFPTLDQYKVNPANLIQGEPGMEVLAPAAARVMETGVSAEIGNYVKLDLGNGYTAVLGQLAENPVAEETMLNQGDPVGYLSSPTRYYQTEGDHLYFEFQHDGMPVDSMDYLD